MSLQDSVKTEQRLKVPFTSYDLGWVILCIGMAIGAGITFMPIQIGVKGIWVFIVAILISYTALYYMQDLYLKTLTKVKTCDNYASIITQYLGVNWGGVLGIAYFVMLLVGMLNYSMGIVNDSAAYLQSFHLADENMSQYLWYGFAIIIVMILLANRGEKLLFKVAGPMIVVKLSIIVLLGLVMIPHWKSSNIAPMTDFLPFVRDVVLTLPFTFYSIFFAQLLNPMNIAYRKVESDPYIATYRAVRASRIAFIVLAIAAIFFAFSFSFSISHAEATSALHQNISAMGIASQVIPGKLLHIMSVLLSVFAFITAFLSTYLGYKEAMMGLIINMYSRFKTDKEVNLKILSAILYMKSMVNGRAR